MNCFYITFYLSNLLNLGNLSNFGIFLWSMSASILLYYIMISFDNHYISVDSNVLIVLWQMSLLSNIYVFPLLFSFPIILFIIYLFVTTYPDIYFLYYFYLIHYLPILSPRISSENTFSKFVYLILCII